jgi:transposase-like protein
MKAGDRVTLVRLEIEHIRFALENTDGICEAAKWLGIDRGTLRKKIEQYGIHYVKRPRRKCKNGDAPSNEPPPPETTSHTGDDDAETSTDD